MLVSRPGEIRTPAERARHRREPMLEGTPQARLGADAADQHDLAARLEHAGEFIERGLRVRHRGNDILRHDDIERVVRESEPFGIHDRERLDVAQAELGDPLLRLAQHWIGQIDANEAAWHGIYGDWI